LSESFKDWKIKETEAQVFFFFSNIFFLSSNQIGYHAIIFKQDKSLARSVDEKDTRFEKVGKGGNRILNG
jgi:hypothetical protein